jgi:hypothetical protein
VGGTIDNIADAAGVTEGQLLELYFTGATTIRNNGGGAGNIRTISGADLAIAVGDVVELVYDGTNWRECARQNVNLPSNGAIVWGSAGDTTLTRQFAGGVTVNGSFTTNSSGFGAGGGGNAGIYIDSGGRVQGTSTATINFLATSRTTDTQFRWVVDNTGLISWGPGGSTAPDTTLARSAAATLTLTGSLIVSATCQQTKSFEGLPAAVGVSVPATFTPAVATGLTQRCNVTAGGAATLTIAAPTSPPSATQASLLVIRVGNTGGGAVTLAWNAAFVAGPTLALPASVANGSKMMALFVWDGANWQLQAVA